jgi:hypothetical protein
MVEAARGEFDDFLEPGRQPADNSKAGIPFPADGEQLLRTLSGQGRAGRS